MSGIDKSISRGMVRAETREITAALKSHAGQVLRCFHEGVAPRFTKGSRLSQEEMKALALDLHGRANDAFTPLWSVMEITPPSRGRPQAGSFEMLHYWINPVDVDGTSNRFMKVALFSAWGDRKQTAMRANDTLSSFYEHAAQRLLQRYGNLDAAVHAIGERLVETLILPTLALHEPHVPLAGTDFHIPFMDGLLLGTFAERSPDAIAGDYKRIWKEGWRTWTITLPVTVEFIAKTYIGPHQLTPSQKRIADEVETWLAAHRQDAEIIRRHVASKMGTLWENGHMTQAHFDALKADFWDMRNRLFGASTGTDSG